jgi:hypothetical protein
VNRPRNHRTARHVALVLTVWTLCSGPASAQETGLPVYPHLFAGSPAEDYLRLLQTSGVVAGEPWSIRPFTPRQVERLLPPDSAHPWAGRFSFAAREQGALWWVAPEMRLLYSSGWPRPLDGPAWAGRGMTAVARGGAELRWGALSLTLAPTAFWAENRAFELIPHPDSEGAPYASPLWPREIDLPQRFGDGPYARLDWGESSAQLTGRRFTAGVSTAGQVWGPAVREAIILGVNAGGVPHVFVGSSQPLGVGIGRIHGRVIWGSPSQSVYSPMPDSLAGRLLTGMVAVFQPRGVEGLELGVSRIYHEVWEGNDPLLSKLFKSFETFFKGRLRDLNPREGTRDEIGRDEDNQLASAFFRWAPPRAGFELYGEYGKEDHNFDLRDLLLQPDHNAGYLIGARRVVPVRSGLLSVEGEWLNLQVTHLGHVRAQSAFYKHFLLRQGHTHRGQALGSAHGHAGAAARGVLSLWTPQGSTSLEAVRSLLHDPKSSYASPTGHVPFASVTEPPQAAVGVHLSHEWRIAAGTWRAGVGLERQSGERSQAVMELGYRLESRRR